MGNNNNKNNNNCVQYDQKITVLLLLSLRDVYLKCSTNGPRCCYSNGCIGRTGTNL